MKISELIKILEEVKKEEGNIDCKYDIERNIVPNYVDIEKFDINVIRNGFEKFLTLNG